MNASVASQALDFLTSRVLQGSAALEVWAWAVFTCVFTIKFIFDYGRVVARSEGSLAGLPSMAMTNAIWGVGAAILIFLYFSSAFTLMGWFRSAGMALSGADMPTVDIGELFRQRNVVSDRIYNTIKSFSVLGFWERLAKVPEILLLNVMGVVVFFQYMLLALISVWVYAKFCLGFLMGGVFIGGLGWEHTVDYGRRALAYVLASTQPLMLLAFMQGISGVLLENTLVQNSATFVTVSDLTNLLGMLFFMFVLSLAAVRVPSEWLGGIVGSGGAPDLTRTASHVATGAGGIMGGARMIANAHQSIGNRMTGGSGGGLGGGRGVSPSASPPSAGNAAIPSLKFKTGGKP